MKFINAPQPIAAAVAKPVLQCDQEIITVDGTVRNATDSIIYTKAGTLHVLEADIAGQDNNGRFQMPITLPGTIGTPMVRHSDGKPTADELYFETTIVNGHITAKGILPSGDWKLLPERVNRALAELEKASGNGVPFELGIRSVTFIVSTAT